MTPGARIEAAIELLDLILEPPKGREDVPADTVVSGYLRGRRYVGSGDRRAVIHLVFGALRHRAEIEWRLDRFAPTPRLMAIAALRILNDWKSIDLAQAFDGGPYRPDPLTGAEMEAVAAVETVRGPRPLAARANLPAWLLDKFAAAFGAAAADEADALHVPPPVDLRVNTLKGDRAAARAALAADGIDAVETPLSPIGLRLARRTPLGDIAAYRDGLVEVQDEGSQLCALLSGTAPGDAVLDYCAGAGGKALAIASMMDDRGRVLATDVDGRRLAALEKRAARAGTAVIETRPLGDDGAELGMFDRVVVDAPCSGSGAWRRRPEAPWRLREPALRAYVDLQQAILARAAAQVRPGGVLAYITCSFFPEENIQQVERFLEKCDDFTAEDMGAVWRDLLHADPPPGAGPNGLSLTPHRTGTDGFYMARLRRAG